MIKKQNWLNKLIKLLVTAVFIGISGNTFALTSFSEGQPAWMQVLPIVLIFGIFFLLVIWPQQRKMKKHRTLVNSLNKGDEVLISSGIFGKVQKLHEDQRTIYLTISDKTVIRVTKDSVAQVISSKGSKASSK
ncbi:MAG: preprotein translocase subunit YajC [SAR324 cluster bacterium]|nr:preprotein translocase subunit YajC [SAR324 cluster bacterium]